MAYERMKGKKVRRAEGEKKEQGEKRRGGCASLFFSRRKRETPRGRSAFVFNKRFHGGRGDKGVLTILHHQRAGGEKGRGCSHLLLSAAVGGSLYDIPSLA